MSKTNRVIRNILWIFITISMITYVFYALDHYMRSSVRSYYTYSEFIKLEEEKMRLLSDFYSYAPERVSEGEYFDVKLESVFGGNITILRKNIKLTNFSIFITFDNTDGSSRNFNVNYSKADDVSSSIDLDFFHDIVEDAVERGNQYPFTKIVDEVRVIILSNGLKEVHTIKASSDIEYELLRKRLDSFYMNSYNRYDGLIEKQIESHVNYLVLNDFDA